MFTGIVEECGRIASLANGRLRILATDVLEDVRVGDSIAVNGCCLTVVAFGAGWWEADISDETITRTSLSAADVDAQVNLERAARVSDRIGGHIVQGHVDGVGYVVTATPNLRVRISIDLLPYLVEKGSITVDGVSLTVVDVLDDGFTVAVIPHTAAVTTLGARRPGDPLNIEVDVLAKYIERLIQPYAAGLAPGQGSSVSAVRFPGEADS